ncbi:uncharacterized protein LOC131957923 [Physella acuta]|uniref:uncharacterized protein LOC131957923 n=1 Tax=Physella acuta TaxID=109671 RepID=UPI0027DDB415|nr:uncharacterized protein LOC131957923 [Physella acuta]
MIIFLKQGLKDSVNISLFSLTIADLLSLVMLGLLTVWYNPYYYSSDVCTVYETFRYIVGGVVRVTFDRVRGWITVFITFERCLCIAMPLRVKAVLTNKRVAATMTLIFLLVIAGTLPVFYSNRPALRFYPKLNRTLFGIYYSWDSDLVDNITFMFNIVISTFGSFIAVIACTVVMVTELNKKTKWRQKSATSKFNSGKSKISNKDVKVVKMVKLLSMVYIVCAGPTFVNTLWSIFDSEFSPFDVNRRQNLFLVFFMFSFLLESFNSSLSIFVYYFMSSRFRQTFQNFVPFFNFREIQE